MKKIGVILIAIGLIYLFAFADLTNQSVSIQQHNEIEQRLEKYKYKPTPIKISLPYENEEALVDLGRLLGNIKSSVSGTSCFGSCHNVEKGGHPDFPLPTGGGDERSIKSELYKKYVSPDVDMPFDKPMKDSPAFVDNCNDTTILWEGFRSDFPFEEQGRRGIQGHDEVALTLMAKNDYLARRLHQIAYGHDTITDASVICAFSAYEQTVVSSESNVSKGIVTKEKGFLLFDKHCYSCHAPREAAPTLPAISIGDHEKVKSPQLTAWFFSPCDFNTCVIPKPYKFRLWDVVKAHKPVYAQLEELTYQETRSINSFIINDLTDHNLGRYK